MALLKASFVRTVGGRDRIYVTRSNGSEVNWVFPTFGDALPHDMIHLVVESAFGVRNGFWGLVDGGADPGVIMEKANRIGGRNKFDPFGEDLSGLALAETLANSNWLRKDHSPDAVEDQILTACREAGLPPPVSLSAELTGRVRNALLHLAERWKAINPKGAIHLLFDPQDPRRTFDSLSL